MKKKKSKMWGIKNKEKENKKIKRKSPATGGTFFMTLQLEIIGEGYEKKLCHFDKLNVTNCISIYSIYTRTSIPVLSLLHHPT